MKYIVETIEVKTTSTGKTKADVSLKDERGVVTHGATIWGDFPNFQAVTFGQTVEGDLVPAKDPKYGPTLYPAKPQTTQGGAYRASGGVSKMMDKKAENIEKAQGNKELGIMTSSTIRMAVDIALAEVNSAQMFDEGVFKGRITYWRKWLVSEWDNVEAPPFN